MRVGAQQVILARDEDFLDPVCGILERPAEPARVHMHGWLAVHEDIVLDWAAAACRSFALPNDILAFSSESSRANRVLYPRGSYHGLLLCLLHD